MKPGNAIEVKDVRKSFKVYLDKGSTIKEKVVFGRKQRYENREVLKGVSFEVKKGEAIGLIGQNGCGKSTSLKLLSRIMYPDSGTIEMEGRVSSLIELGAGFHPDMSGRENIYINASIFGLTHKEIAEREEDIIAFSELEEYIDNPVRTYSSGMYMRLAFAVAINVEADILLIDEILAVGDAGFQQKCFNRLQEIKKEGTTIVIVSHSMGQIEAICDRSIWIHKGEIREQGECREVHPLYMDYMNRKRIEIEEKEKERLRQKQENNTQKRAPVKAGEKDETPDGIDLTGRDAKPCGVKELGTFGVKLLNVELFNSKGEKENLFCVGDDIKLHITYERREAEIKEMNLDFSIFRSDGVHCFETSLPEEGIPLIQVEDEGAIDITLKSVNLLQGKYSMDFFICGTDGVMYNQCFVAAGFEIANYRGGRGLCMLESDWSYKGKD